VSGCGAWNAPCATIGGAIGVAQATGRTRVRVSTGLYQENFSLVNGISVLGGHSNINWVRNPAIFGSTIRGVFNSGSADQVTITANNITTATELSGFNITSAGGGIGGNSVAIHVINSNQNLTIRDNDIAAGSGGQGANGAAGSSGTNGSAGSSGLGALTKATNSAATPGGAGGSRTCGSQVVSGGTGGEGNQPLFQSGQVFRSGSGAAGQGSSPGNGGQGGVHTQLDTLCRIAGDVNGRPGAEGAAGTDASGGAGGSSAAGSFSGSAWRGASGAPGSPGVNGSGGGGGGSAGGSFRINFADDVFGATGGGGGSGGCAGAAGGAGLAGGGSFSILVVFTNAGPSSAADMPVVTGNTVRRGIGGQGGDGGTGGGGGQGGAAGPGGLKANTDSGAFCLVDGAPGGVGGRGGHGSGGGGGAGGVSFDIFVENNNGHTPNYAAANTFTLPASSNTAGAGGSGGNSSNPAVGIGGSGVAGLFGNTRFVP
jgi:hypothetical protein